MGNRAFVACRLHKILMAALSVPCTRHSMHYSQEYSKQEKGFYHLRMKSIPTCTTQIDGYKKWQEVDFHIDIEYARNMLKSCINNFGMEL